VALHALRARRPADLAGRGPRLRAALPAITGAIFEFGFTDAIQQMWAAYLDELAGGDANGFHCATPEEAADHHALLDAALRAGTRNEVTRVEYAR
jgi:hypothetical protein